MRRKSALAWVGSLTSLAAVVAAWLVLGPIGLGGSTGYTFIIGSSMEPKLEKGDLVLVRSGSDYKVGDAVAYKSKALDRIVLHRIVEQRGDTFVLKGDANDFTDPGVATSSDMIGKYWIKIGGAAPVLEWMRQPLHAAVLAGLLGLMVFGRSAGVVVRRGRKRRPDAPRPRTTSPGTMPPWQPLAVGGSLALLASAILGVFALNVPPTRTVPAERIYVQNGAFAYGGPVRRSAAYPDGHISAGDAVFTKLVHELPVAFDWRFDAEQKDDVRGTAQLTAEVTDGIGWSHRLLLAPRRAFTGSELHLAGTLDLDAVQAALRRFELATGTHAGSYQVRLLPEIQVTGTVGARPVDDSFMPSLRLTLDQLRLAPAESTDPDNPNGLVRETAAAGTVVAPNHLSLLGRQFSLDRVKLVAAGGALASLLALLFALLARRARPEDEIGRVNARYGRGIVRVSDALPPPYVDVMTIEELARVAERYDRLILQCDRTESFFVGDDGVNYRWRTSRQEALDQALTVERRDPAARPWAARPESASAVDVSPARATR
jgi:signal peptidase